MHAINSQDAFCFSFTCKEIVPTFVFQEFTQFVTVDDAGILYILEELVPPTPLQK
jgi:hypothetical protein